MDQEARIKAKVAMREAANELADLGEEEFNENMKVDVPQDVALEFWNTLGKRVDKHRTDLPLRKELVERDPPMTTAEVRQFERQIMTFGMHKGMAVSDVSLEYFDWLDTEPDFRRQLNRYLRNPKIQNEPRPGD